MGGKLTVIKLSNMSNRTDEEGFWEICDLFHTGHTTNLKISQLGNSSIMFVDFLIEAKNRFPLLNIKVDFFESTLIHWDDHAAVFQRKECYSMLKRYETTETSHIEPDLPFSPHLTRLCIHFDLEHFDWEIYQPTLAFSPHSKLETLILDCSYRPMDNPPDLDFLGLTNLKSLEVRAYAGISLNNLPNSLEKLELTKLRNITLLICPKI
ncbi:unnamed protein product [Ambrosiozyma monospora]|uniref:Unnamed protein product n=1 Tax=Ambrosiozyma monospora TaxID=43982 RepID=A0ACB5SRU3_AMBMO|nr:unnamed protein product [Ambrosiozyma monospora]